MEIIDVFPVMGSELEGFEDRYLRLASSNSPCEAEMSLMMLRFIGRLRQGVIGPQLYAFIITDELCLDYHHAGRTANIKAKIDYKDHSTLVDGVPVLHYRLACSIENDDRDAISRTELRTRHVDEAYEFVIDAIRTCRREF